MSYQESTKTLDKTYYKEYLDKANVYNELLYKKGYTHDLRNQYKDILDIDHGMMGMIEINKINVYLPICHGTSHQVLNNAIGHLESSSFPSSNNNIHTILTGHTGLPNAQLFTDLDRLSIGDLFYIHILNETYTYRIKDIYIVDPNETSYLNIVEGKNYCTLMTCTPYGINSHRLLVVWEKVDVKYIELKHDLIKVNDFYIIALSSIIILSIIFIKVMCKSG